GPVNGCCWDGPTDLSSITALAALVPWLALLIEGIDAFLAILGADGAVVGFDLKGIARSAVEIGGPIDGLLGLAHRNWCIVGDTSCRGHHLAHQGIVGAHLVDHSPVVSLLRAEGGARQDQLLGAAQA